MNQTLRHVLREQCRHRSESGLTLTELMVGLLISALFVPFIWTTIRGAVQFFEATIWQVQLERDLDRLTTLLDAEAKEACLFSTTAAPNGCAALAPVCTTADDQLRMRVTLPDNNNASTGPDVVITYRRYNSDILLRTGPRILADGRLDPANTPADEQMVMRGVTAFTVTPNDDCNTARVEVTVRPVSANAFRESQGFGNPVTRTIGLRSGSRLLQ